MSEETNIPSNPEIDQLLKEFEAKSQAGQVPQAPQVPPAPVAFQNEAGGIKFETDNWKQSVPAPEDNTPKIVQLVMKWSGGAIKDQRQAEYVLLGLAITMLVASFYLFFGGGPSEEIIDPYMPAAGPDDPNFIP